MTNKRSNLELIHPNGNFMCHVGTKKLNFYKKKNLVKQIGENQFQLTFMPGGEGVGIYTDKLFSAKIENKCSCCGSTELLEMHHIIPYNYRTYFPEEIKQLVRPFSLYDICIICTYCHRKYEREADDLKDLMVEKFNLQNQLLDIRWHNNAIKSAKNYVKFGDSIPEDRQIRIKENIRNVFALSDLPTNEKIEEISMYERIEEDTVSRILVERLLSGYIENYGINQFSVDWRKHFDYYAEPIVLREYGWEPNRKYECENKT